MSGRRAVVATSSRPAPRALYSPDRLLFFPVTALPIPHAARRRKEKKHRRTARGCWPFGTRRPLRSRVRIRASAPLDPQLRLRFAVEAGALELRLEGRLRSGGERRRLDIDAIVQTFVALRRLGHGDINGDVARLRSTLVLHLAPKRLDIAADGFCLLIAEGDMRRSL